MFIIIIFFLGFLHFCNTFELTICRTGAVTHVGEIFLSQIVVHKTLLHPASLLYQHLD
jgi:hypothetical protein